MFHSCLSVCLSIPRLAPLAICLSVVSLHCVLLFPSDVPIPSHDFPHPHPMPRWMNTPTSCAPALPLGVFSPWSRVLSISCHVMSCPVLSCLVYVCPL
ncbi:hypothetical protein BKA62DRAFT_273056 [Auriculariales sp. MPI-PUGE-AT-0066]|nr:hypothetical protein BKA62DRAFT_273056 [Auriculariales sp. MPI-PUGE-AT-0066]